MNHHSNAPFDLNRRHVLRFFGGLAAAGTFTLTVGRNAFGAKTVKVEVEVGDGLKYSTTKIEVAAESEVELTLKHTGKMAKAAMGHNLVILKSGTKVSKFATAAMGAVKTDYIPAKLKSSVIAHTKLIGGGETDTITFKAPDKGTYPFLCTFPGHYTAMNGKLIVS